MSKLELGLDLAVSIPDVTALDEQTCRSAALVICGNSADAQEARDLLAMCGLLPAPRTYRADGIGRSRRRVDLGGAL